MSVYSRTELAASSSLLGGPSRTADAQRTAKNRRNLIGHLGLMTFGAALLAWQAQSLLSPPPGTERATGSGITPDRMATAAPSASYAPVPLHSPATRSTPADTGWLSSLERAATDPSYGWTRCDLSRAFPDLLAVEE